MFPGNACSVFTVDMEIAITHYNTTATCESSM